MLARLRGALTRRQVLSLLPEHADELAQHERVVFIDADLTAPSVSLERLTDAATARGLHRISPVEVVRWARALGFVGEAWVCRLPVASFEPGPLTPVALRSVGAACAALEGFL